MKRLLCVALVTAMLAVMMLLPVSAEPYTEQELEEYMEALYCEPVWAQDFPSFQTMFLDVDFDGRQELIVMETGEEYAPKQTSIYAFMDAELSGRGWLTIGKLFVCRDPKTGDSLILNRMEQDGKQICQRMIFDPVEMMLSLKDISEKKAASYEDYGWHPVVITKAQTDTVKVYEDSRAIFLPAYNGVVYDNGQPPVVDPTKADSVSTYLGYDPVYISPIVIVIGLVVAVLLTAGVVVGAMMYRKRSKK